MKERHADIASLMPANLDALPRRDGFRLRGIGERPRRIAEGVLTAIHDWLKEARP
jgi:hypothetical protein